MLSARQAGKPTPRAVPALIKLDFEDFEIETRQGFPGDAPLTLFTDDVFEEVPGVTLTNALGFVARRSRTDSDEIDLDFTFPRGLVGFDDEDGDKQTRRVVLMIQYAPAGSGDWSAIFWIASSVRM